MVVKSSNNIARKDIDKEERRIWVYQNKFGSNLEIIP
jgi:hypothetical protein